MVTGNHDLPRISFGRTAEELKLVFAFILALPCVPLIYYGDEIGMKYEKIRNKDGGYCRTGSRTPMQWTDGKNAGFSNTEGELYLPVYDNYKDINVAAQEADASSLLNEVKKLVEIKRRYPELFACGNELEVLSEGYPLVFSRTNEKEKLVCAVNPSDRDFTLDIKGGKILTAVNVEMTGETAALKAVSYLWMKVTKEEA